MAHRGSLAAAALGFGICALAAGCAPDAGEGARISSSEKPGLPVDARSARRRLILIGLDAADERMISAGVASGELPNFARMIAEGASGPLKTHRPILSPILWTTIATGLTPDLHGVLDFVEVGAEGRTVPVTSRSRRAPAFWEILGGRGTRCGIVGWLATYPAGKINGFLISDRFTVHPYEMDGQSVPADPAGKTYPPDLFDSLRSTIVSPASIGDGELRAVFGAPSVAAGEDAGERHELRVIEAVARTYTAAALRLEEGEGPDLLAVYFEAIDRLMHLFGTAMPPAMPGTARTRSSRYGHAARRFYAAMDARLGQFLDRAGVSGTLIVVSDHGFKIGDERPRHPAPRSDLFAAEWHRDPGVILAWGQGIRRGVRIDGADIYDIVPTILAYFGAPGSEAMRGHPLEGMFEPGFLPPIAPRVKLYTRPEEAGEVASTPGAGISRQTEEEEILGNLRTLGYIGGAEGDRRASSNLAAFFLEEKQYDRAIGIYRQVLAKDPRDLTALYNLGYAYKGLGSPALAAACFEKILRERPDYTEARLVLSDCYVSLGRAEAALDLLRRIEGEGASDPGFQNHLGTILASAGRLAEAEAALERAIALRPSEASPYLNLSRVRLERGDRAGAIAALERARSAAPDDPRVAARLGELRGALSP